MKSRPENKSRLLPFDVCGVDVVPRDKPSRLIAPSNPVVDGAAGTGSSKSIRLGAADFLLRDDPDRDDPDDFLANAGLISAEADRSPFLKLS